MIPAREPQWRRHGHGRRPGTAAPGPHAPVLELQRMAGNRAVTGPPGARPEAQDAGQDAAEEEGPAEAELRGHQRNGPDRLRIGQLGAGPVCRRRIAAASGKPPRPRSRRS